MQARILVVDDEKLIRWSIRERLTAEGYDTLEADNGASASALLADRRPDLVLLDLRLPDTDGMQILKAARESHPDVPIIIITAYSSVESAVEAIKSGAADYVTKPFNLDALAFTVRRTLEAAALRRRLSAELSLHRDRFGLGALIGESPVMKNLKNLIRRVAAGNVSTVLLLGESGTGKDMIARAIHYESARADGLYVNITCSALPESLLESEIFGHERGAFTDARAQKKGLFELADGGTAFLDEVGDMAPVLQAKLLRVLEEKAFRRVGGTTDIRVDTRVIAATNRNLTAAVKQGNFREDLFYRLSAVPIVVPPLRERSDDVPLLARHFLEIYCQEFHRPVLSLTPDALEVLSDHSWPGNVRELRNVIERTALFCPNDKVQTEDILLDYPSSLSTPLGSSHTLLLPEAGCNLDIVEKELVEQALVRSNWNQTRAARLLAITRDQIRYRIERFGLGRNQQT